MTAIVIGGDTCPVGRNLPLFLSGDAEGLFRDALEEFRQASFSVVNLECPLIARETPAAKCGPNLGAPLGSIAGYSAAGISAVNLANNHILDHGPAGLRSTLEACRERQLHTVGAGENLAEARRILLRNLDGLRLGVLSMAEHEFCIAAADAPGANPLDLVGAVRNLQANREIVDYMLVLLHGGAEHFPYPTPQLREICRFLIEHGADAVLCQHSHCVGCYENYRGGHILYGQGNLLFDYVSRSPAWHRGVLVRLDVSGPRQASIEFIPLEQSPDRPGVRKMASPAAAHLLKELEERSDLLQQDGFLRDRWRQYCREQISIYAGAALGQGRLWGLLNRYLPLNRWLYSREALLCQRNLIRCETHREVLETVFSLLEERPR